MARKSKNHAKELDWQVQVGAEIEFKIYENDQKLKIFTTRPDTIYGATFIAISINHHIVRDVLNNDEISIIKDQFKSIEHDKEKNWNTSQNQL